MAKIQRMGQELWTREGILPLNYKQLLQKEKEGRKGQKERKQEGRKNSEIRIRYFFKGSLRTKERILTDAGG